MNPLDKLMNTSDEGAEIGKKYLTASYEYSKLKVFYLVTQSVSTISKLFILGSLLSIGVLFLAIAGAIVLGDYFENSAYGYLAIGVILFVVALIVYAFRNSFDKKIIKKMSHQFYDTKT